MVFDNIDDVEDYFSGDQVECLECHQYFKHLANHVMMKHKMTPNEYKTKYNIPFMYSLASKSYRDKQSKALTKRICSGDFTYTHLSYAVNKAKKSNKPRNQLRRSKDSQNYIDLRNQLIKLFKQAYFDENNFNDRGKLIFLLEKMQYLLNKLNNFIAS